jgi:carbon monoxide dehydrogenase subunit G
MSEMIITDQVAIPLSPPDLFSLITDLDAVVPCVPGAILNPDDADAEGARTGQIVIAFGPIRYRYDGTIRTIDVDRHVHRVTYQAAGTETSGEGTVGGELTLNVVGSHGGSTLEVSCEAQVTGMVADYGQDMAEAVAQDIIKQFANAVRDRYASGRANASAAEDNAARLAAAPKPIGGLRLLLRVTLQRIRRKIFRSNRFGSKDRTTSRSNKPSK